MILTAVLIPPPEGGFSALNPEAETTTQGESVEEAIKIGTLGGVLKQAGITADEILVALGKKT